MSKGEQKSSREKKKPKQAGGKTKAPSEYASRNAASSSAPTGLVKVRKK